MTACHSVPQDFFECKLYRRTMELPGRSGLAALFHLLMGQKLKENSRLVTFLGGVSVLPATIMPQTQELRQQNL